MTTSADTPDTFPARLKGLMVAHGFNQTTLAKKSGIDRTVINRLLKGSRPPKPEEIGLLAQCFSVAPDTLMDGLQLPPQVQRAVDKERVRTEELLAMEAARDEANARAVNATAELERVQREREAEREEARAAREATDARCREHLENVEARHSPAKQTSDKTIENLKGMLERANARIGEGDATQLVLRKQIAALQQQLAHERSAKAGASVLGGLVGIALGRAMD